MKYETKTEFHYKLHKLTHIKIVVKILILLRQKHIYINLFKYKGTQNQVSFFLVMFHFSAILWNSFDILFKTDIILSI